MGNVRYAAKERSAATAAKEASLQVLEKLYTKQVENQKTHALQEKETENARKIEKEKNTLQEMNKVYALQLELYKQENILWRYMTPASNVEEKQTRTDGILDSLDQIRSIMANPKLRLKNPDSIKNAKLWLDHFLSG